MSEEYPYPPSIAALIEEFAGLPGIGRRSAERIAYHVLAAPRDEAMRLAFAIRDAKKNIRACTRCFHVTETALCAFCADPTRDAGTVCVVELPRDLIAFEKAGGYRGVYHVLQGRLAPADGIGPEQLRVHELRMRINSASDSGAPIREIILAMNPTADGDATAAYLATELAGTGPVVTRLARGLASGTEIESTSPSSLRMALEGRKGMI